MGIIDQLLSPPGAQQLKLGLYLIYFMLLFLLPYMGVLLVTVGLSVTLRKGYPELARYFVQLGFMRPAMLVIFGLVPLLTLAFLLAQFLFGAGLPMGDYMERITVLLAGALLLLYAYGRTEIQAVGAAGVALLGLSLFCLVSVLDLVYHPGMWQFIDGPLPWLFSWTVVAHFALYIAAGHFLAGVAITFLYFYWPEKRVEQGSAEARPLRFWGLGLTLGGAMALPPLLLWSLVLSHSSALTFLAIGAGMAAVGILFMVAVLVVGMLFRGDSRHALAVLVFGLAVMALLLVSHQQLQLAANREHAVVLAMEAQKVRSAAELEQQLLYVTAEPDPALGKKLFDERCVSCHAWDKQVVGPAYLEVLPKYVSDPEALHAFIRNPVKINPNLPVMPNQGLSEREVLSVSAYLLQELPIIQEGANE